MYGSIVWATEKSATIVSLNGLNEVNQSDNIRNVVNNFSNKFGVTIVQFWIW